MTSLENMELFVKLDCKETFFKNEEEIQMKLKELLLLFMRMFLMQREQWTIFQVSIFLEGI
jgi:hypothetical protein